MFKVYMTISIEFDSEKYANLVRKEENLHSNGFYLSHFSRFVQIIIYK